MKKFVSISTFDPANWPGEVNDMPSMTVPDQTLSIEELISRYARGQSVPSYVGLSDEELGFIAPDVRHLDLTQLEELRFDVQAHIDAIRARMAAKPGISGSDISDDDDVEDLPKPKKPKVRKIGKLPQGELPIPEDENTEE